MMAAVDQPIVESLPPDPADATTSSSFTPPNSANGKKDAPEGVPSELSDLELDQNASAAPALETAEPDDVEIEPDHYWGDGKIPVFKPVSVWSFFFYPTCGTISASGSQALIGNCSCDRR